MNIEIIECENGYLILEGNAFGRSNPYERRKWVANTVPHLQEVIGRIALEDHKAKQKTETANVKETR